MGVYFGLRNIVSSGEIGWICVLAAFPFALGGFFTYKGMTFEKFLLAFIRSELLSALDAGSATKLTINNKRLNRQDFEQKILLPRQDDYLDSYRAEYNAMLMDKVTDTSNSVVQERYVTLSVHRKSIEEARAFFDRVTADITTQLNHLDARSEELDAVERLRVLHDFCRTGEETEFHVDLQDLMRKGHSFKDAVCPDSLEFKKDYFVMGGKYGGCCS